MGGASFRVGPSTSGGRQARQSIRRRPVVGFLRRRRRRAAVGVANWPQFQGGRDGEAPWERVAPRAIPHAVSQANRLACGRAGMGMRESRELSRNGRGHGLPTTASIHPVPSTIRLPSGAGPWDRTWWDGTRWNGPKWQLHTYPYLHALSRPRGPRLQPRGAWHPRSEAPRRSSPEVHDPESTTILAAWLTMYHAKPCR